MFGKNIAQLLTNSFHSDEELEEEDEILDEKEYEQTTIWQAARDGNERVLQGKA